MIMFPALHGTLFLAFICVIRANLIGVDFASDAMKVALIQPGNPLEIVANFQSKRKTPTCITFYRGERMFGADSVALMGRKPELSFAKTYRMIGREVDHPSVQEVPKQYYPYELYKNETTGHTCIKLDNETYYTPEELIAMLLQHAMLMTEAFGGKKIKDCVITVPAYFTQHERKALFAAAEIADLNVLSLIEENTAAALHYATDKGFDEPQKILFYNMGAGSVQTTIVSYSSYPIKEGGKNKTVGQFEVLGKSWDSSLGGFNFDVVLSELLADRFNAVWNKKASGKGKDLRDYFQPMTKLRLQAGKVKEILSANNEFPVRIEQLHEDIDLNTKVTRAELEEAAAGLLSRVTHPIDEALTMANLTMADISGVELLGGAVRMPKVKALLEEYFKESKVDVGQHLNGDESMALGAVFRAANLSTQFRVRKVGASDTQSFGVAVRVSDLPAEGGKKTTGGGLFSGILGSKSSDAASEGEGAADAAAGPWSKFTEVFAAHKTKLPTKTKSVTFAHDKDISCSIEYSGNLSEDAPTSTSYSTGLSNNLPTGTHKLLAKYNITGITEFAAEAVTKGWTSPTVKLGIAIDSSGIASLVKAEIYSEIPIPESELAEEKEGENEEAKEGEEAAEGATSEEAGSASADDKGGKVDEKEGEKEEEKEGDSGVDEVTSTNSTSTTASDAEADSSHKSDKSTSPKEKQAPEKAKKQPKMVLRKLTVKEDVSAVRPPVWSGALLAEAKARIQALQAADEARQAKEAALNDLEGFIYKSKNDIMDQEDEIKAVSTDEQRQAVVDFANEIEEWLYEDGRDQTVEVYNGKKKELIEKHGAIFSRLKEISLREEAVKKAKSAISEVRKAVGTWEEKMPQITEEEKAELLESIDKADTWIEEKVAAQDAHSPYEQPLFAAYEVPMQMRPVSELFSKLMKKPKPEPEPEAVVEVSEPEGDSESGSESESNGAEEGGAADAGEEGAAQEPTSAPIKVEIDPEAVQEEDSAVEDSAVGESGETEGEDAEIPDVTPKEDTKSEKGAKKGDKKTADKKKNGGTKKGKEKSSSNKKTKTNNSSKSGKKASPKEDL